MFAGPDKKIFTTLVHFLHRYTIACIACIALGSEAMACLNYSRSHLHQSLYLKRLRHIAKKVAKQLCAHSLLCDPKAPLLVPRPENRKNGMIDTEKQ